MIITCKSCGIQLTRDLHVLENLTLLNENDEQDFIPAGYYFVSDGAYYKNSEGKMIVNLGDVIQLGNHPDLSRRQGCCGMDGLDGINKICLNGHEVATERSDCWMAHAVIFETELITLH